MGNKCSFNDISAKKYIDLFSKSGCPNLHALKIINSILVWPPLFLGFTRMSFYYISSMFVIILFLFDFYKKKIYDIYKNNIFELFVLDFRRKRTALA